MFDLTAGRRALVGMAVGLVAAGGAATAAASGGAADLTSPAGRLRAFMLMRGALDDRLVMGGAAGTHYALIETKLVPLFGFVSTTFAKYRAVAGGYEGASYEVPFYTDLETGTLLTSWKNPYTGELVQVPQIGLPPARLMFTQDLDMKLASPPPGMSLTHSVAPAIVSGDDVWMAEETTASFQIPQLPAPFRVNEMNTLHARLSDLVNPRAKRVPCLTFYQGAEDWRPWMKMGAQPGCLLGNGVGRYFESLTQTMPGWLQIARAHRPDVLGDPAGPLDKLLAA